MINRFYFALYQAQGTNLATCDNKRRVGCDIMEFTITDKNSCKDLGRCTFIWWDWSFIQIHLLDFCWNMEVLSPNLLWWGLYLLYNLVFIKTPVICLYFHYTEIAFFRKQILYQTDTWVWLLKFYFCLVTFYITYLPYTLRHTNKKNGHIVLNSSAKLKIEMFIYLLKWKQVLSTIPPKQNPFWLPKITPIWVAKDLFIHHQIVNASLQMTDFILTSMSLTIFLLY